MAPTVSLFPEGEPKAYGEYRGEVLGRPFRRFEVQVYGARRLGAVGHRFTGVLYEVELPRPFLPLHLAPRGWPTYPRERWPFLLALLMLSGVLLALLARHLAGHPALKPGTSLLLLLVFPALYLYLFAAWRVATREAGPEVALEGELARRFRAWGYWDSIGAVHLGCRGPKEGACLRVLSSPPKRPSRGGRRGSGGRWGPSRGYSGP